MTERDPYVEPLEIILRTSVILSPDYREHTDTIKHLYELEFARISNNEGIDVDRIASLSVATMCRIIDEIRDLHPTWIVSAILGDESTVDKLLASLSDRWPIAIFEEYQPYVLELLLRQMHELHPDYNSYIDTMQQLHNLEIDRLQVNLKFTTLTQEQLQRLANSSVAAICDAIDIIRSKHKGRLKKAISGNEGEQEFLMTKLSKKLYFTQTYDTQDYDATIIKLLLRPLLE